ncbi:hypothetical protein LX81_03046 [Palleronia aestuarii]|uniref:Response regulatory domain-containing protein n=1 Tax=Palleronia aestuarii TaxID=568105 RepID=A0A2W7N7S7_9RHOB|nr:hypothetical protein [Palleronia aestuarii]PZX14247.1 hypothetical protein LX81_03046 [Palleronia aestuarii]
MTKKIHVAAENAALRESLKATIETFDIGDVVMASTEGEEGTVAVRETKPDILVVSTSVEEDTAEHLQWYRDAAPQAHIVGFAFNDRQAEDLRDLGIETVVSVKSPRAEVIRILQQVDRDTPD